MEAEIQFQGLALAGALKALPVEKINSLPFPPAAPAFWFDPALLARSLLYPPQIPTPRTPMEGQTDKRWHSRNCGSSGPSHLQGHTHALLPWEHTPLHTLS